jgi:purine-binding chemotaxis protein CheW
MDSANRILGAPHIAAGEIEDVPSFGTDVDTEFILGMGKAEDHVTILLDIDRVLATTEVTAAA